MEATYRHVHTKTPTGRITFTFSDNDGSVFSSFAMNPGDLHIAKRLNDACLYFEKNRGQSMDDFISLSDELESKICNALGCDRDSVFGKVSAATVLPDGEFFAAKVLRTVSGAIAEETARRRAVRMALVDKFAGKYDADPTAGLAPGQEV